MKISLITDGIYPYVMGGMQKHSYFLAKFFARAGVQVDLYHYVPNEKTSLRNPFTSEECSMIDLIDVPYPQTRNFPGHYLYERYIFSKAVLGAFKERSEPDFIYVKGFAGWALLKERSMRKTKTPIGVNFHGYEMFQKWPDIQTGLKLQILKLPVKYHIKKADYLFSYGGKISEILQELGAESKIVEIPTGISSEWLENQNKNSQNTIKKFVFVGRAERRKGIQEIHQVLKTIDKEDFEFHFIGPIKKDQQLLHRNIVYHGPIYNEADLKELLDQMDILICPSHSEGMPNVIMEGMARGLAIIATDVGAVNKMVDAENGCLLNSKDITGGIQKAVTEVLNLSESELLRKKNNSIKKVRENFTWEKVIHKTIKEIQLCLKPQGI